MLTSACATSEKPQFVANGCCLFSDKYGIKCELQPAEVSSSEPLPAQGCGPRGFIEAAICR